MLKEVIYVLQDEERSSFTHMHALMEYQERSTALSSTQPSTDLIHTGRLTDKPVVYS